MEAVFDPVTRKWSVPEGEEDPTAGRMGLTFADQQAMKGGGGSPMATQVNSDMAAASAASAKASQDPLLPSGVGGFLADTFKAGSNVAVGMGTGLVDLGLLGVDAARAATGDFGGLTQGLNQASPQLGSAKKMTWSEVGESRDNPLTAWRIQTLTPESTTFKAISYMGEIASWFVNPKGAGGLAVKSAKAVSRIGRADDLADAVKGVVKGDEAIGGLIGAATKIKASFATERAARFTNAVTAVEKTPLANSSAAKRIIGAIGNAEPVMAAQMERALINSASRNPLVQMGAGIKGNVAEWAASSPKEKLNTLGEVVLKDLYANFMVMGARPIEEDASGMSQWLANNTPPPFSAAARFLVPEEQDYALVAKTKMLVEGAIIGFATQPLIDAARVGLMARRNKFSDLSPEFRDQILGILQNPGRAPDFVALKARQMGEQLSLDLPQGPTSVRPEQLSLFNRTPTLDELRAQVSAANAASAAKNEVNRTMAQEQTFSRARTILGQPGSAPGPTTAMASEAAPAPSITFKTARGGSEYTVHADGTTTRVKGASGGVHAGDVGAKEKSSTTIYVDADTAEKVGQMYAEGPSKPSVRFENGKLILKTTESRRAAPTAEDVANNMPGKILETRPKAVDLPFSTEPAVGLSPVEFGDGWKHLGSPITEVNAPSVADAVPGAPTAGAAAKAPGIPAPTSVEDMFTPLPTPHAVVSPEAIRNAAKGELDEFLAKNANDGGVNPEALAAKVEEVGSKVMGLLPHDRSGRVDYMKTFIPRVNRAGVMDPIDAIWHDGVTKQGLEEGWVRLADDFSGYQMSRAEAQALDESDALSKLADEVFAGAEQERLLKPAAADVPAAEQTVDVQAAPVEQASVEQAPMDPTAQSVVTDAQAKIQTAGNQLQDTVQAGVDRQPQAEPLAPPAPAAAAPTPALPGEVDAVGQMQAQLQEIIDNPGAAGTPTRALNERRAKMLVSQLDSQGQWDGRGLRGVDEGALAPAVDEEAVARALQDEVFSPISAPVPPKLTDSFEISLPKISQNEKAMLAEAFGTGEAKVAFGAYSAKGGAKGMGEVAEMLEGMTKADGWTQAEIRTGASLSRKIRRALEGSAAAINEQSMVDGMAKEAVNDIKGLPNCDLTELL